MEYSDGVEVMLMDKISYKYKHTEEGIGRLAAQLEESAGDIDDCVDVAVEGVKEAQAGVQELTNQIVQVKVNNHELEEGPLTRTPTSGSGCYGAKPQCDTCQHNFHFDF